MTNLLGAGIEHEGEAADEDDVQGARDMADGRPSILFVFTDDQRFDTIRALNNPDIHTPNIDRLVASGLTFTQAHIMGGTSGAVCMPSRAMMLSGRTLFSIEREGQRIPPEHVTFPELFRQAGYTTFHAGKWHQDKASHARCFAAGAKIFGFRRGWYETCDGHWHLPVHDFDPTGTYAEEDGYFSNAPVEPFTPPYTRCKEHGKHSAETFSDATIDFIQGHHDETPFFIYLAHLAPHDPRQSLKRIRDMYDAEALPLPENFCPRHPFDNGELRIRDELLEGWPRTPDAIRRHIADYYAIITQVDEQLGRVMSALEESGRGDNTIVIFAGDNGLAVGQHGLMGKQNVYEHSVRVPLIISGPGIPAGARTDAFCYLLDIFPTLCDLTGLSIPSTVEGRSLLPVIEDPDARVRDRLLFAYKGVQRAVKEERLKLIEYSVQGQRTTQLFDLETDPWETQNLAEDPAYAGDVVRLRGELRRWRDELGDTREMGREFWGEG